MGHTGTALVPTSMTAAPCLIQLPLTISGEPTAAMTMSAWEVTASASGVFECTTVTVASLLCASKHPDQAADCIRHSPGFL